MQKTLIILIITSLLSCNSSKPEDLKKIDSLKIQIDNYKDSINKIVVNHVIDLGKITKRNDSLNAILKKLSGIDLTNDSQFNYYSKNLNYKVVSDDNYWKRGVYYTSKNNQEYFYNVRTSIINNQIKFFFMGINISLDESGYIDLNSDNDLVNIYELDENKNIHIVDSFHLLTSMNEIPNINQEDFHLNEFMLLQLDNLIIKNGRLYYYKVKKYNQPSHKVEITEKEYYEYQIGSKKASKIINNPIFSNLFIKSPNDILHINNQKTILADNSCETLTFYQIDDWNNTFNKIYNNDYSNSELKKLKFNLSDYFGDLYGFYNDLETEDEMLLIGGTTWHSRKNKLYFDNSGITYACIWEINLEDNTVNKIVPEHKAIHPFFFEIKNKEYISYVEENKIMLCESPSNFN